VAVQQVHVQAGSRPAWWQRLSPASFVLAGLTALIVRAAVASLLSQGRLGAVLGASRAELAAPLLVGLVVVTGICERIWPAEPRPVLARGHVQDACYLVLHRPGGDPADGAAQRRRRRLAYHRLHHAPDIQTANLGVVFTVWDVLPASRRSPPAMTPRAALA
jgi:hypothetical protein